MAIVVITRSLERAISKRFKEDSIKVLALLRTLEDNPKKGKFLAQVGGIAVKELKYRNYRFYFVTDGYEIKFYELDELTDTLITFVRMSTKKEQQKTIDEIKNVLRSLGGEGFS